MNCCTTERCCQLQFINSYVPVLHDVRETRHIWRYARCCWVAWTDSLLDSFVLTVATFHPSKHSAMTCGSFSTYGFLVTAVSSKTTVWYTFVQDITIHCARQHTTYWHNILQKWNLHHSLVPYIEWMFNSSCLITWPFLEWLSISVYTLH